jgi:hypothetical protein
MTRTFAAVVLFTSLTVALPAYADSEATGNMFYQSCMAAASIMEGNPPSDALDKAPMCFGSITAIINLEPFLKPEYAMCPPKSAKITYGQIVLVIASYLRNHPEALEHIRPFSSAYRLAVSHRTH